jgi:Ca2+-binding EF-hand superfamily protein
MSAKLPEVKGKINWADYIPQGIDASVAEEWHKKFTAENPDSKVSKAQFEEFYKLTHTNANYQHHRFEHFEKKIFKKYDQQNTGKIDFTAFMVALGLLKEADLKCIVGSLFNLYDKNDDNVLTKDEVSPLIESLFDLHDVSDSAKKADELIDKADVNKDNKLSKRELIAVVVNDADLKKAFTTNK